ncbi:GH92 family glycosyl hydrolase [Bacteroides sp.]|uniref:GH92 family glycosyl hydrolase n=1 Tax=Bacteroides sp. TaxID=29523 RepID=UPI0025C29D70|nr:GH92 family glycosyl hydrolase [Bacteroides sp.]
MKHAGLKLGRALMYVSVSLLFLSCQSSGNESEDLLQYVDPFVGTTYTGHTFPGATYPLGFMQPGPQTGNFGWDYCAGYRYEDPLIWGFSQNRLNGTGVPDLGDLLVMPFSGTPRNDFRSTYKKESEKASPGYYAVTLDQNSVDVEITTTPHVALYHYSFEKEKPKVFIDFQNLCVGDAESYHGRMLDSKVTIEDNRTITGNSLVRGWVERNLFYVIQFDKPFILVENLRDTVVNKAPRKVLHFDLGKGNQLNAKIAFSTVSVEGAKANMEAELSHWNFAKVRKAAEEEWQKYLYLVKVTGTEDQKKNFYTSMYHLFVQPNNIADVDGRYRGANDSIYTAATGKYYSTFSLWDTYRAAHPMYTVLCPDKAADMVNTMIAHADVQGYLPIWAIWGKENFCMIGNHGVPVVAEACLKDLPGIDQEKAYQAIRKSLTENHYNSEWDIYDKYGYLPVDLIDREAVSKTLEFGYDDYSAALLAKKLGKQEDYEFFMKRASYYKNLFDPETKLMRGKDSQGKWRTPFNPFYLCHGGTRGGDYTEGNAWQYSWHVQQDVDGLVQLMGGKEAFAAQLDTLFELEATEEQSGGELWDVTGLIGQYAHGNEPSHHVIYLYSMIGKNYRTAELAREICDKFYQPRPDGLCGNDDCGQMSAWYMFTALGFYPVNPASGEYVIGSPQLPEATIQLANGKTFTMIAENLSAENKYVKSVRFNDKEITDYKITYAQLMDGGVLKFEMTDKVTE